MSKQFQIGDEVFCKEEFCIESDLHPDLDFTFIKGFGYTIVDIIVSPKGKTLTYLVDDEWMFEFSSRKCKNMPKLSDFFYTKEEMEDPKIKELLEEE